MALVLLPYMIPAVMCFLVVGENSGVVRFGQYDSARRRPISFDVSQGGGDECVGRSSQGGVRRRLIVFEIFVLCGPDPVLIRKFLSRDVLGGRKQCSN